MTVQLDTDALLAALGNLDGTTDHVLTRLAGGKVDWVAAPGAAGGEANTASNQGAGGVGVFKQKTSVDLEFKNLNAGSNKITVTDDTGNNEIDIDAAPENIMPLTTKGDIMAYGTAHSRLPVGTNDQVLTADSAQSLGVKWADAAGGDGGYTLVGPKGSDQASITSTSMADITGLTFSASANTNYYVRAHIVWSSTNSTEGCRLGFNGPAGTYTYSGIIPETDSSANFDNVGKAADAEITCNAGSSSNEKMAIIEGLIQVSGASGTIAARVAAETGSGASVTIHEESFLVYQSITT